MRGQAGLLWYAVQNNTSRGVNEEAGQQGSRWWRQEAGDKILHKERETRSI